MLIGEGGNLREVGDTEYLLGSRELLQLLAHGLRRAAPDATVDLIKDQRPLRGASASAVAAGSFRVAAFDGGLERQHDARELAAGGDLLYRAQRLAGIGRDKVLHLVEAACGPVPFFIRAAHFDLEARLH